MFAPGDGLGPYRRLLDVAARKLRRGGALAIQLHRRVLVLEAPELPQLELAA